MNWNCILEKKSVCILNFCLWLSVFGQAKLTLRFCFMATSSYKDVQTNVPKPRSYFYAVCQIWAFVVIPLTCLELDDSSEAMVCEGTSHIVIQFWCHFNKNIVCLLFFFGIGWSSVQRVLVRQTLCDRDLRARIPQSSATQFPGRVLFCSWALHRNLTVWAHLFRR